MSQEGIQYKYCTSRKPLFFLHCSPLLLPYVARLRWINLFITKLLFLFNDIDILVQGPTEMKRRPKAH